MEASRCCFRGHVGSLQVRGSMGMASGPGMTARVSDQQDSGGFSGALLGGAVTAALGGFRFGDDRGVISEAVLYLRID
jgi:hypothetical protein